MQKGLTSWGSEVPNIPNYHEQYLDSNFSDNMIIYAYRIWFRFFGTHCRWLQWSTSYRTAFCCFSSYLVYLTLAYSNRSTQECFQRYFLPDLGKFANSFKLTYQVKLTFPFKNWSMLKQSFGKTKVDMTTSSIEWICFKAYVTFFFNSFLIEAPKFLLYLLDIGKPKWLPSIKNKP